MDRVNRVADFYHYALHKDYISFDLFDTLIRRRFLDVGEVHDTVSAFVLTQINRRRQRSASDLTQLRYRMSNAFKASERMVVQEPLLEQVWDRILARDVRDGATRAHLVERIVGFEHAIELANLALVDGARDLLLKLKTQGKVLIATSDMYFSVDHMKDILRHLGILDLFDHLYVSAGANLTKQTGDLFRHVLTDLGIRAEQLIHAGDNLHSDIAMAGRADVRAVAVDQAPLLALERPPFGRRHRIEEDVADLLKVHLFGLLFDAQDRAVEQIYFLGRDGCAISRFFHLWKSPLVDQLDPPRFDDLFLNRVLTCWGGVDFSGDWLTQAIGFAFWLNHAEATASELSALLGIEQVPASLGTRRLRSAVDTMTVVQAYIDAGLKEPIRAAILAKRATLERYLEQIGFFALKSVAFADVGYSGTVMRDLNSLFLHRAVEEDPLEPPEILLHLLATNDNYAPNQVRARPFVDFAPPVLPSQALPEALKQSFAWLEFFFKHPTLQPILRFIERDGRLTPDLIEGKPASEPTPGRRVEHFALGRDTDVVLLWMAACGRLDELASPLIKRFAEPDRATVDQMRDEVFELHSIDGARRSIILEMPDAAREVIEATARREDYWIPGSLIASGWSEAIAPVEEPVAPRKPRGLKRLLSRAFRRRVTELMLPSRGFDAQFYGAFYPDLAQIETDAELWGHYLRHGRREGRMGSRAALLAQLQAEFGAVPEDFDPQGYLRLNPDLAIALGSPERALDHYMRLGRHEGRVYRASFAGLADAFERLRSVGTIEFNVMEQTAWDRGDSTLSIYFDRHGIALGPWVQDIDVAEFRALHSSWCGAVASKADCIIALCEKGIARQAALSLRTPFDVEFYRAQLPELAGLSPDNLYRHYLSRGATNGLAPSEQAALFRLWGHAEFPACFDWKSYRSAGGRLSRNAGRAAVLAVFIDAPGADRIAHIDRRAPDSGAFLEFLAERAFMRHDRREEAKLIFEAALAVSAHPGRVHHRLGDLAARTGQPTEALARYRSALASEGTDRWSYVAGAEVALDAGDYATALAMLGDGRDRWQEMAPWRRVYERALNVWSDAVRAWFAQRGEAHLDFDEADRIIAEIGTRLAPHAPLAGATTGVLVLTGRSLVHASRDGAWRAHLTIHGLGTEGGYDYLDAMLRHDEVILHEVPFSYPTLRAIGVARALGKRITLWLGDLVPWRGHAFERKIWAERGIEVSALRETNFLEYAVLARYCDHAVTTMAGCAPLLGLAAPHIAVETARAHRVGVRGAESTTRSVLVVAAHDSPAAGLAGLAAGLRDAAGLEPHAHFLVDTRLGARPEMRAIAGRWTMLAEDPDLSALAALVAQSDAVVQLVGAGHAAYALWAEAANAGLPALLVRAEPGATISHITEIDVLDAGLGQAIAHLPASPPVGTALPTPIVNDHKPAYAEPPRRKRILFANVFFAPQTIGGATRVLKDNIDYLIDEHGDEFEVAVFTSDEQNADCGQFSVDSYRGIPVFRMATPQEVNMDWRAANPMVGTHFETVLDAFAPDLVHIHCLQRLTVSVAETCRAKRLPYVVTLHDAWWISDFPFLTDADGLPTPVAADFVDQPRLETVDAGQSLRRAERLRAALLGAQRRLAVSERFAELHRQAGIPCETVENGTSRLEPVTRERSEDRVRLCHIGGLEHHKGAYLVEAALRQSSYDHLHFTVVDLARGVGDDTHTVWGTTPVTITGKMTTPALARFYARMDVLLAPSTWPESYGLVTREALAHGLWVVAGDQGAMGDPVVPGENGFVVSVADASGVAGALAAIDADPARYRNPPAPVSGARTADDQSRALVEIYRAS